MARWEWAGRPDGGRVAARSGGCSGHQAQASGPGPPLPTGGKNSSSRCSVASSISTVERAQGAVELVDGARADDRGGHAGPGEQPGQRHVGRVVAPARHSSFSYASMAGRCAASPSAARPLVPPRGPALGHLAQHAGEQPAVQRRPRDDAQAVVLRGRDHLQLDVSGEQVVDALLGDQAEEVALPGGGLRLRRCASRRSWTTRRRAPCPGRPGSPSPARSPPTACSGRRGASGKGRSRRSAAGAASPRRPGRCVGRTGPGRWATRPSCRRPWWPGRPCPAGPPPWANQRPMICSVRPSPVCQPYTLAVSKKLMPCSSARSMMAKLSGSVVCGPKFIVPRQSRLTDRPVRPRFVYSIRPP